MGSAQSRYKSDIQLPPLSLVELGEDAYVYTGDDIVFVSDKLRKFLPHPRYPGVGKKHPIKKGELISRQQLREMLISTWSYNDEVRDLVIELQASSLAYKPFAGPALYLFAAGPPHQTASILIQCSNHKQYLAAVRRIYGVIREPPLMVRGFSSDRDATYCRDKLMDFVLESEWQWSGQHSTFTVWSPAHTSIETRRMMIAAFRDVYDSVTTPGSADYISPAKSSPRRYHHITNASDTIMSTSSFDTDLTESLADLLRARSAEEFPRATISFDGKSVVNAFITFNNVR